MLFAVIGLGVLGRSAALELQRMGNTVIGVDIDSKEIDKVSDILQYSAIADATDKGMLEELNLTRCDGVLVSIGDNLEASVLCTLNLREMGIRNVWVKAKTESHGAILSALKVRHIIQPEHDMGIRIAQAMNYPIVVDHMALGDDLYLIQVIANDILNGQTIEQAFTGHDSIEVFMIKRGASVMRCDQRDFVIEQGDRLVLSGPLEALKQLSKAFKVIERNRESGDQLSS
ncbi:TrkA family potassium uptake protein [Cardiobacteriaceae bacterium TAE3-ERU3]|nr:TrkA family potassium uptake protein [Cardiobacteriaceae bacterium TAE3-ERU3]